MIISLTLLANAQKPDVAKSFVHGEKQTRLMLKEISATAKQTNEIIPRTIVNGQLKLVSSADWTSGFFPGVLWYIYEFTQNIEWKREAEKYTALLEKEQYNRTTHDLGFMIYCSYGNGYRLTKDSNYKKVIIEAAKTLLGRFNKTAGVIKSWESNKRSAYPVIIDNMMNLELLFEAFRLTGDSALFNTAVTHANTTLANHFRADYSSYHVLDYDTITGNVVKKITHQGYADSSAWARGQAWALYGYTVCYRETKNPVYLRQAENIASFILSHPKMPSDMVPYWDYNVPEPEKEPRDASAAAITASALYQLGLYSKNKKYYKAAADKMLISLNTKYTSAAGANRGFILEHSTGHKPANSEIDVPLNYADYYYLEALLRSKKLK